MNNKKNNNADKCTICTYPLCTSKECSDKVFKNISNNENLPNKNKIEN